MFFTSSSGGRPTVNEHSPMPWRPTSRWPSRLLVAPKIGGCGFWSGFGSTRRGAPMRQNCPSAWYSSSVHALTMWCSASRRHRAVEHLGVRAVRVLLEEMVLDGPEGMEADPVAEDGLLERVLVRLVF